jgi:hypothetical protein
MEGPRSHIDAAVVRPRKHACHVSYVFVIITHSF